MERQMTSAFLIVAVVLTAPPLKPAEDRITIGVKDKIVHMKPDGTDVVSVNFPDGLTLPAGINFSPDRRFGVSLDQTGSTRFVTKSKLVMIRIEKKTKPFTLDGYIVGQCFFSANGSKVYFTGAKGDEIDPAKMRTAGAFVLDVETKKLEPLPVPEKHTLVAVAPDGKTLFTGKIEEGNNNKYTRKNYLVLPDGKPVEVLKENLFTSSVCFSPDGSKVAMQATDTNVTPAGATGKKREYLILDVATKQVRPFRDMPKEGVDAGLVWSPTGSRLAYARADVRSALNDQKGQLVPDMSEIEYKVFVADADGGNPKEVYKTKGFIHGAFMWK
jgi:hypothetical protein